MKYPKEVQERLKILDAYVWNESLKAFDILHLYDDGLAYPDGYYDARFFNLIGFNTELMQKRDLGRHDVCDFWDDNIIISKAQVWADGAFLIVFAHMIKPVGMQPIQSMNFIKA